MSKLTFDQLEKSKDHAVWVLNTADRSDADHAGEVVIGVSKINGSSTPDLVIVPQTWIPCCVTDYVPKKQLLASSEFRKAVAKNLIKLITSEKAEQLMQEEGAKEERKRLADINRTIRASTAAKEITNTSIEVGGGSNEEVTDEEKEIRKLNPQFVLFANSIRDKDDMSCLNLIRSRGKLKIAEINHLMKSLNHNERCLKYLSSQIKALREESK